LAQIASSASNCSSVRARIRVSASQLVDTGAATRSNSGRRKLAMRAQMAWVGFVRSERDEPRQGWRVRKPRADVRFDIIAIYDFVAGSLRRDGRTGDIGEHDQPADGASGFQGIGAKPRPDRGQKLPHPFLRLPVRASLECFDPARSVAGGPNAILDRDPAALDLNADNSCARHDDYKIKLAELTGPVARKTERMQNRPLLAARGGPECCEHAPF
jgi:hypothetical protein